MIKRDISSNENDDDNVYKNVKDVLVNNEIEREQFLEESKTVKFQAFNYNNEKIQKRVEQFTGNFIFTFGF